MPLIKVLLILAAVGLLILAFRHRERVGLRAGWRVVSVLLVVAAVVFIINPNIPQYLAEAVGVTRGTDLILYVLIVVFFFTTLGLYFRLRQHDQRLVELARSIAIEIAIDRDGAPGPHGPAEQQPADRAVERGASVGWPDERVDRPVVDGRSGD